MAIVRANYIAGHNHSVPRAHRFLDIPDSVLIEVGRPHEPRTHRECGTDIVWPVLRILNPPGIVIRGGEAVCRHEIEAGD